MTIAAMCEPRGDGQWRVELCDLAAPRADGVALGTLLCTTAQKDDLMRKLGDPDVVRAHLERQLVELREAAFEEIQHAHQRAARAERAAASCTATASPTTTPCSATRRGRPCNGTPVRGGDGRCWWCASAPTAVPP